MPTLTIAKPAKKYASQNNAKAASQAAFCAPWEPVPAIGRNSRPILSTHGGYGALSQSFITGPFSFYENAKTAAGRSRSGIVVRWGDFVKPDTTNIEFRIQILRSTSPLTVGVKGYLDHVHLST